MTRLSEDALAVKLYPYQILGADFLSSRRRALLADEMGVGKSAQAIAACDRLDAFRVLVICPASVCENWRREFERFSRLRLVPMVLSYDKMAKNPPQGPFDVLIVDEAHYLKSADAKRTKAVFGPKCDGEGGLVERARHVFLLTGTPMPNHPAELWPMLRACCPEAILSGKTGKPYGYWQFVTKYCTSRDNGFGVQITGGRNHKALAEKLEPFMLRRLKSEVLADLPPISFDTLWLTGELKLDGAASAEAAMAAEVLKAKGVDGLREIAPHVATLRRLTGMAKVGPVVEWVKDWLDGTDRKIVLFAWHRDVITHLNMALDDLAEDGTGTGFVVLEGSTPMRERTHAIDRFQTDPDCRVFIGQITAAGTGITLTAASDVLFVEADWTPANNLQAAMRTHRIGQRNAVLVRFATLAGSIDEQIMRAVARKTADVEKVLG